ncbi:hypothetical protein [Nonomuraea turcica]|uniref:hypothetical protein n=1 Tax=Nonomuraea sp. G32 TaxID=3067274 RepID=UPI00273BA1DC|nr:hypothetical protein [Nonomuraea sp. G32]MDP4503161.1 hypothetical protein [Nonomuraea sp. G32]
MTISVRALARVRSSVVMVGLLAGRSGGGCVAFAGYLVSGFFRRMPLSVRPLAGPMALGGLATVLGTLAYLFWIVASGATGVSGTLFGRPPLWLLLQVLTVG